MPHLLYGAPLSLYTGKVRAYLNWKNVDYEEVLATPDIYRSVILPEVGFPVIPVIRAKSGEIVQDSTEIIDFFEALEPEPPVCPAGAVQKLAALFLELYGDEWLLIPAMHYRWNHNEEWVYGEFGAVVAPGAAPEIQVAAGREAGARFRGFVPVLGINQDTIPAIEASYEAFLGAFDRHLADHPFLFGTRPSIGDYGLIGPLYAHLWRDPVSGALMRRLAPRVAEWVSRVEFPAEKREGEFLPADEIPETLLPILRRQMREQLPTLLATADLLQHWAQDNPGKDAPPRQLGPIDFTLAGPDGTDVHSQRAAMPYPLWMLQRALDHLAGLSGSDRERAAEFLDTIGAGHFVDYRLPFRLRRENYRLKIGT